MSTLPRRSPPAFGARSPALSTSSPQLSSSCDCPTLWRRTALLSLLPVLPSLLVTPSASARRSIWQALRPVQSGGALSPLWPFSGSRATPFLATSVHLLLTPLVLALLRSPSFWTSTRITSEVVAAPGLLPLLHPLLLSVASLSCSIFYKNSPPFRTLPCSLAP